MADAHKRRRNIDFPNGGRAGGGKFVDPDAADSRERGESEGHDIVVVFADATGIDFDDPEEREYAVSDAITALLHYAASQGMDIDTILQRAEDHFEHEQDALFGDERDND